MPTFRNTLFHLNMPINSPLSEFYMPTFRNTLFHINMAINSPFSEFYMPTFRNTMFHMNRPNNSPLSEFYMPTFRNTLFHLNRPLNSPLSEFYMPTFRNTLFHINMPINYPLSEFYMPTFRNTLFHINMPINSPLNFMCRRFGTLNRPIKVEQTECSETSAYKIQTPGNYPDENTQHSEQGKILKSTTRICVFGSSGYGVAVEFGVDIIANVPKSQILHYFSFFFKFLRYQFFQ